MNRFAFLQIKDEGGIRSKKFLNRGMLLLWGLFSLLILGFFMITLQGGKYFVDSLVINAAQANFEKDIAFRKWATKHGGVYVPANERTPPNPNLEHIPERDLITPSGKKLTLMNPAYMMRQMMDEFPGLYGSKSRITSLRPLNPNNSPDEWEKKALQSFDKGEKEALAWVESEGQKELRLMRPFVTEEGCLKCHGKQGYKVGDIRGGIGVRLSVKPFVEAESGILNKVYVSYGMLWIIGSFLMFGFHRSANQKLTEIVKAQQEANYANSLLRTQQETSPDGILLANLQDQIISWNQRFLEIWFLPEEIMEQGRFQRLKEVMKGKVKEPDSFSMKFLELQENSELVEEGVEIQMLDDRVLERHSRCVMDMQGAPWGRVWFYRDITTRKNMEEELRRSKDAEQQANAAKSRFLAVMSHDIRTPLNAILGLNDLLMENEENPERQRYLYISSRAGHAMLGLLNDLLDLSRIESGQFILEQRPFSVKELLQEVVSMHSLSAMDKGITLSWEVSESISPYWMGDDRRIGQVLNNLCNNALKYTDKGSIHLSASWDEKNGVCFAVRDTGPGIPLEKQTSIFSSYVQLRTSEAGGGVGLGLSICHDLVVKMGGQISVESQVGTGSCFKVHLPLAATSMPEVVNETGPGEHDIDLTISLDILLVDDSEDNRMVIQGYLRHLNHKLTSVENGALAVEKIRDNNFDLVLMDLEMPIMNGFEAARRIREMEREEARFSARLVAMTAHALLDVRQKVTEAGFDMQVTKPVRKYRLLEIIRKVAQER